ncbi:AraC family transcriptional regulator ligand-binding domain-containing protein [Pseudomonas sp. NCHU5208]|uniref:AraC family transcriptional regulator n=1 Tax=unclassified Pseudomonas TaxID=196821 RepID=UPI003F9B90A3
MHSLTTSCFQVLFKAFAGRDSAIPGLEQMLASAAQIPVLQVYRFLEAQVAESGDLDLGLRAYAHFHPSLLGVKSYAMMSSATLKDALQHMVDYHPLTSDGSHLFLEQDQAQLRLVGLEIGAVRRQAPRAFIDAGAALALAAVHWLAPFQRPMPLMLELTYAQPEDTRALRRLFGAELRFGAARNCMTFSLADGAIALPTAAPALHPLHVEYARTWLDEQVDGSLEARVRRVLSTQLSLGISPGLGEVADQLGMSRRSLQHGLMRDAVNFTRLLDDTRRRHASSLLRNSTRSLKYISAQLGFRDQSSFHKACMRWFGVSPQHYRLTPAALEGSA